MGSVPDELRGDRPEADAATIKTIDNAMNWLKKDLATDAAKNADFRLIFMHHPVSDAYTKRYIPAVIEPGKVDLLLSGHTHQLRPVRYPAIRLSALAPFT